ncbi:peptidoglycan-binding protein [Streptomyces sp. 184]|uniref:peptidoglycan-binding protein n=1 Tax=Streptomyces sp. 184 TaxID=1827526 RepID=UPI00389221BE
MPHAPGTPLPDGTLAVPYAPIGAPPEGPADADLGLFADDPAAARGPRDPYDADYADYADYADTPYDRAPAGPRGPYDPRRPRDRLAARRRRRLTLVLTVGGVVAALSVGLLGSGLFSGDGDDDRAVPKPDTITAVPTGGGTKPGPEDTRSGAPTAPADGEDPAEPSAASSDRAGAGEGDPDEAATERAEAGTVTAAPPGSGTTAPGDDPTSGTTAPGGRDEPAPPPALREGDSGPEVLELQKRLIEAGYNRLPGNMDGDFDLLTGEAVARFQYDNDVEGDERGVYGPATRRVLESMTKEP